MDLPFGVPLVVSNPKAGDGRGEGLGRLRRALRSHGVVPDVAYAANAAETTATVREEAVAGRRFVIAVGGDGTVRDVVEGLLDPVSGAPCGPDPVLGIVGSGTGCDLARTFGLDRRPEVLAKHMVTDATVALDIGRVTCTAHDGTSGPRLFVNVAEVGYGAKVAALANRLPRRLGRGRYAAAIAGAGAGFRRVETHVGMDTATASERLCNVIVANGQFFGGGLHVAPHALPTDGRFDVQTWGGTPLDVLRGSALLRRGQHLQRDDVHGWRSRQVRVDAAVPLHVEADGDPLGTTPAAFDVLPGALRLKL